MKFQKTESCVELERLVEQCRGRLFRFAFFRLGSREEAEDVVQEAFLRFAALAPGSVRRPEAYLFRMTVNGCNDRLRRRRSAPRLEPLDPNGAYPAEDREALEEAVRIETLLGDLPAVQAEAIRLHVYSSLRFTEIAEVLDCPATTVKSRFAAGIGNLKKMLNL